MMLMFIVRVTMPLARGVVRHDGRAHAHRFRSRGLTFFSSRPAASELGRFENSELTKNETY
ncbi:hypothetical protein [Bradyrhizobium sp. CB3481]|uniref:hypothetical protein n=1 Tax=Bradyrhizobium sp. CB3481 TaxID=3039158 RepID=UPI0024B06483|nr:hypothetical protein [Bradyrhizobium sp. CB3481]WFU14849.1 hypothetical protein QA643_27930 [Bradyrhizobium sp. CB3481]